MIYNQLKLYVNQKRFWKFPSSTHIKVELLSLWNFQSLFLEFVYTHNYPQLGIYGYVEQLYDDVWCIFSFLHVNYQIEKMWIFLPWIIFVAFHVQWRSCFYLFSPCHYVLLESWSDFKFFHHKCSTDLSISSYVSMWNDSIQNVIPVI